MFIEGVSKKYRCQGYHVSFFFFYPKPLEKVILETLEVVSLGETIVHVRVWVQTNKWVQNIFFGNLGVWCCQKLATMFLNGLVSFSQNPWNKWFLRPWNWRVYGETIMGLRGKKLGDTTRSWQLNNVIVTCRRADFFFKIPGKCAFWNLGIIIIHVINYCNPSSRLDKFSIAHFLVCSCWTTVHSNCTWYVQLWMCNLKSLTVSSISLTYMYLSMG